MGGDFRRTVTEDVRLVVVLWCRLEHRSYRTLHVQGVLGLSRLHADDVLQVTVVEIQLDRTIYVRDFTLECNLCAHQRAHRLPVT